MKSVPAEELYNHFLNLVRSNYESDKVHNGKFGAMMDVALVNDGPVTLVIESDPQPKPDNEEAKIDNAEKRLNEG